MVFSRHCDRQGPKIGVRNGGEIRWNLSDLGWAWYVNDLSKYLPDADTLADMTPAEDCSVGVET